MTQSLALPREFSPHLTEDRLTVIAERLLDLRFTTLSEMASPFDDNYTRETAIYGRQRNMLIQLALNGSLPWLTLANHALDVTFRIGDIPCRFFTDDADGPQKRGFFRRNASDNLFEIEDRIPVMWRFVVAPADLDVEEDRVYFIGYNAYQEKVSEWVYTPTVSMLHSTSSEIPPAVELPPVGVNVRPDSDAEDRSHEARGNT